MKFNEAMMMENAMDQSKQCSNKATELEKSSPNMCPSRIERTVTECERLVIVTKILQNKCIDHQCIYFGVFWFSLVFSTIGKGPVQTGKALG